MNVSNYTLAALGGIFATGLFVLGIQLYGVQVTEVTDFKENLRDQATRRVVVPGLRGRILDRRGLPLADSRPCRNIVCRPAGFQRTGNISNTVATIDAEIDRLAKLLGRPRVPDAARIAKHLRTASAMPLLAVHDVDDRALARFEENADSFPNFETLVTPERIYPFKSLATHILGYVGMDRPNAGKNTGGTMHYFEPEMRGRAGIEGFYDRFLAGTLGERILTVNARGFTVGEENTGRLPENGPDLSLTLDAKIQLAVERELKGLVGAAVVLDPNSGAVLAIASSPTFDPNDFVPFVPARRYRELSEDPNRPLINRALAGLYAPGSTFKPIVAIGALAAGWNVNTRLMCNSVWRDTRCTARWGHGDLDLREGIKVSCNPFFLQLGTWLGGSNTLAMARQFGLGSRTGIDILGEYKGNLTPWHFQSAMGQGPLLVTPLQMCVACAALANGGKVYRPFLHARTERTTQPQRQISASDAAFAHVRAGMLAVVEEGSARSAFHPNGKTLTVKVAGKTGSAEVSNGDGTHHKNVWFIAFAPYAKPRVAIAMVIEHGEFGGSTVAPRIYRIMASIFGERSDS